MSWPSARMFKLSKDKRRTFFSLYFAERAKICFAFLAFVEIIWLLGLF